MTDKELTQAALALLPHLLQCRDGAGGGVNIYDKDSRKQVARIAVELVAEVEAVANHCSD